MVKFPYSRPDVIEDDIVAVKNALKGQFLIGNIIGNFEKKISNIFNVQNSIVCNSGTRHYIYIFGFGLKKEIQS